VQSPWTTRHDDRPFLILAIGLVGLAWISLFIWGMTPYDRYLSHDALDLIRWGNSYLVAVFVGGWTLMVIAMMLPTSLPLINLFRSTVRSRADKNWLVGLLIIGYLAVWVLFGVVVHIADFGLHQLAHSVHAVHAHPWIFAASVFAVAGLYQFTELKYRCLDKCRSPLSFVTSYWRGRDEWRNSFALGVHHGIFCVGCCWSLMLLMFAVGHGNLGWMLILGAVMGAEKNLKKGRAIVNFIGLDPDERVAAITPVTAIEDNRYIITLTRRGQIKKTPVLDYKNFSL
jgi:predicted metal-binding membrane protein